MLGLHGAVEEMLRHYDRELWLPVYDFTRKAIFRRLGNELAISAYRIVQEALSNVIKHATASPCAGGPDSLQRGAQPC